MNKALKFDSQNRFFSHLKHKNFHNKNSSLIGTYCGTSTQVATKKYQVLPKDQPRNNPYNGLKNSSVWIAE